MRFTPEQYAPHITGDAATKLAMSAVAPLVACAAGLRDITTDNYVDVLAANGHGASKVSRVARHLHAAGRSLAMPWHDVSDVHKCAGRREAGHTTIWPHTACLQWRPDIPLADPDTGKTRKYDMPAGSTTPIGAHPATPLNVLAAPQTVLIAEGLLKAYSALTAWLTHNGVNDDVLTYSDDPQHARTRLLAHWEDIEHKLLIVTLVGVGNWHGKPGWNTIGFADTDVLVAFDADAGTNYAVWKQASQLFELIEHRKANTISLLRPTLDNDPKSGVDDYLAAGHTWDDLAATATDELPPRPTGDTDAEIGTLRVNDDRCVVEQLVPAGDDGQSVWRTKYPFAGRITSIDVPRQIDWDNPEHEERTGKVTEASTTTGDVDVVRVEVTWNDPRGQHRTGVISGPSRILSDTPDSWSRREIAEVPTSVVSIPGWPPERDWLECVKAHRTEDIAVRHLWSHMGWVPTPSGNPVFVAGESVVGANGPSDEAVPGALDVRGFTHFGLNVIDDPDHKTILRDAITQVVHAYHDAWDRTPGKNEGVAAVVLAAALRPVVPVRPTTVILFSGPPGSGKTWSAKSALGFWQRHPGTFTGGIPGSASDTAYSMEKLVAATPLWVADDLAPSMDAGKNSREEAAIGDIVRLVFNGATKNRGSGGPGHKLRVTQTPRAVFMATVENALSVSSQMDRVVHIPLSAKALGPGYDQVNDLNDNTVTANLVLTAAIQSVARMAMAEGWETVRDSWMATRRENERAALNSITKMADSPKSPQRHAQIAADLSLGLEVLQQIAFEVDCSDDVQNLLSDLHVDLARKVAGGYMDQIANTPGTNLMRAVRKLLGSGKAHIAGEKGEPPVRDSGRYTGVADTLNSRLGWRLPGDANRSAEARGDNIGFVAYKGEQAYVVLDADNAFEAAKRHMPDLIPHGQKAHASWDSAWSEGLCADEPWKRRVKANGQRGITVRARGSEGVPFTLEALIGYHVHDDDEHEATPA